MQKRTPAVAGMFYSDDKYKLELQIKSCFLHKYGPKNKPFCDKVFGIIAPHAGYEYSGPVAAQSYHAIQNNQIDLAVIIGPNHWGIGENIATTDCVWQTPLGEVIVDVQAVQDISKYNIEI